MSYCSAPFAAALVVQKKWLAVAPHDVARLEIAIEKVVVRGAQQEFRQTAEIVFQRLFVERNAGQAKKVVLEIVQVPGDRLAIEAAARIAHLVIQIASRLDLKAGQHGDHLAIGLDHLRSRYSRPLRCFERNSNSVVLPRSSSR